MKDLLTIAELEAQHAMNRDLVRRVRMLEQTVRQLRAELAEQKGNGVAAATAASKAEPLQAAAAQPAGQNGARERPTSKLADHLS